MPWTKVRLLSESQLLALETHIADAARLAATATVKARIEVFRRALEFSAYIIRSRILADALTAITFENDGDLTKLLDTAAALDGLLQRREQRWDELKAGDDLTGESIRAMMKIGLGDFSAISRCESQVYDSLARGIRAVQERGLSPVDLLLAPLQARHPESRPLSVLKAMLQLASGPPPDNLLGNSGFEADGRADAARERAPQGWTTWQTAGCTGRFRMLPRGSEGDTCAEIVGARAAVLQQQIPVQAGELYFAQVEIRRVPGSGDGDVRLQGGLQDRDGKWLDGSSSQFASAAPSEQEGWVTVRLLMSIPAPAANLVFMCAASGLAPDEAARFDNVVLFRVDTGPAP